MEQVSLKIGERLKEIRNTRQLTLDDVSELTGVSKPMLGQIERGQSSPTINILWKIVFCQVLFPEKSVEIPCFRQGIFPTFGGH